jgi:hypothetical protein
MRATASTEPTASAGAHATLPRRSPGNALRAKRTSARAVWGSTSDAWARRKGRGAGGRWSACENSIGSTNGHTANVVASL